MSFSIGENVGPYRIIEQLGQGGMATVYKAYHASLDRYVALKVLHQAFNQDQTFTARFQREARVVAKLEHPNIVPVYDYSEHEARPYLIMKYIEGDTLKARLNLGPLTSREIEDVINSIGSALAYAHRQGILHRDIKPSNVMIANDGVMYLADFGLARIAQAGESTMSSDSIMGTPQYISPEQAMGKKDLDAGTDIYSFGVMLYEMVVGRVPFSSDTPFSIIHDHIYTPLPLPMKVNPNVPESVQRVLLKSLAKDRLDRYETVEDMMQAFKGAWAEAGVPMQGTSITMPGAATIIGSKPTLVKSQTTAPVHETIKTAPSPRPAGKGSPWIWVGVGVVVLVLCIGGAFAASKFVNQKPPVRVTIAASVIPVTNIPPATTAPTLTAPTPLPPPATASNVSPAVGAAQDAVNKHKDDPQAHLNLSLALWDDKQFNPALEELNRSAELAGPQKIDFFSTAATEFKKREAWIPATGMYVRLYTAYSLNKKEMPKEVENDFHETVYKASELSGMLDYLVKIDSINLTLGYVVHGRYALFNGTIDNAQLYLAQAEKSNKPDKYMYEVDLLKAEYEMKNGNQADAKSIVLPLSSNLGAPEWIRTLAGFFLNTLQ